MTLEIDFKIENLKTHPPDIHSQDQLSNPCYFPHTLYYDDKVRHLDNRCRLSSLHC